MTIKPLYRDRYRAKFFDIYSWFIVFSLLFNLTYFIVSSYLDNNFFTFGKFLIYVAPSFIVSLIYLIFRKYIKTGNRLYDLSKRDKHIINIIYILSIYSFVTLYKHLFVLYSLPLFLILTTSIDLDKEIVRKITYVFHGINTIVQVLLMVFFGFGVDTLGDFVLSMFVLLLGQKFAYILVDYMNELLGEVDKLHKKNEIINNNFYKATNDLKIEPMTGLYNKKTLNEALDVKINNYKQYGRDAYLVMIDLDFFKSVNDTYGHDVGDKVLITLANLLKDKTSGKGSAFRFGGEEFCILYDKYDLEKVKQLTEDIRVSFGSIKFPCLDNNSKTLSAGITRIKEGDSPRTFLKRADEALYTSKQNGRNQVTIKL